jgi:hypothetical protein
VQDGDRLAQRFGPMAHRSSEREPERRAAQDDGEEDEAERPTIQREEQ